MRNPIIVALDVPTAERAVELARQLGPYIGMVKIGSELFTAAGPDIVRAIRAEGVEVFLDLKFHDIPNTVARAVEAAVRLNVQMLTVHTSGGLEMLRAAQEAAERAALQAHVHPPVVLGVTVLTSLTDTSLQQLGINSTAADQVRRLASLAVQAGLGGVVCSPIEIPVVRSLAPPGFELVTPGIRAPGSPPDDQKRTRTAAEALAAGATRLVIGRPIVAAADPCKAALAILDSLRGQV
ncbi:MAG: orotidine-5'-phosphate decarboxylase [Verrucomicrobiae bacterium]|nr:orotidine-5'-phosphate decarboxylase [Verrucomicrobiae bacterium]